MLNFHVYHHQCLSLVRFETGLISSPKYSKGVKKATRGGLFENFANTVPAPLKGAPYIQKLFFLPSDYHIKPP